MIRVENVYHDYTGEGKFAVRDVSFTLSEGEIFGFLGPSGAGKSTMQNILTGLLKLQKGDIFYGEKSVRNLNWKFFNKIGVSFEHPNLYNKLTGFENLKYFAGLFGVPTEDPMKLMDRVNLKGDAHKRAGSYSKGMKQRLVFCRALLNRPEILFLDEPTSGLDPTTAEIIKAIIREKQQEGCTILLTTHNMFTADQLCNRVAFLNEGQIVALDRPKALKLKHGEKSVEVEYLEKDKNLSKVFFLDNPGDKKQFHTFLDNKDIQTIHSREATLEQIFIKLTGRGLE